MPIAPKTQKIWFPCPPCLKGGCHTAGVAGGIPCTVRQEILKLTALLSEGAQETTIKTDFHRFIAKLFVFALTMCRALDYNKCICEAMMGKLCGCAGPEKRPLAERSSTAEYVRCRPGVLLRGAGAYSSALKKQEWQPGNPGAIWVVPRIFSSQIGGGEVYFFCIGFAPTVQPIKILFYYRKGLF